MKTLIRLGGCPGWSASSLSAQSFCWFCNEAAHIYIAKYSYSILSKVSIIHDFHSYHQYHYEPIENSKLHIQLELNILDTEQILQQIELHTANDINFASEKTLFILSVEWPQKGSFSQSDTPPDNGIFFNSDRLGLSETVDTHDYPRSIWVTPPPPPPPGSTTYMITVRLHIYHIRKSKFSCLLQYRNL